MNASIDPAPSLLIAQILLDPFTAPADLATPEMDWTADRIWNLWWQLMCLTTTARLTWAGVASAPTMVLSIWREKMFTLKRGALSVFAEMEKSDVRLSYVTKNLDVQDQTIYVAQELSLHLDFLLMKKKIPVLMM